MTGKSIGTRMCVCSSGSIAYYVVLHIEGYLFRLTGFLYHHHSLSYTQLRCIDYDIGGTLDGSAVSI